MAFVLINSITMTGLFSRFLGKRFFSFFFFELLTPFCVCHTFSLEPFVHQTRVQTITTKIYRVVQKVRILKQKLVFRLLINPNAVQATILYYKI